jgi:chaperonin GroES
MKPIGRKIVVKVNEAEEKTASGVIIPLSNRHENEGVVRFVSDKVNEVSVGDRIRFYSKKSFTTIDYQGEELVIMNIDHDVELVL